MKIRYNTQVGKSEGKLTHEELYIAETEGWMTGQIDQIITTSNFMRDEISQMYKITAELIQVVPCGVAPEQFVTRCNLQDFRRLFVCDESKIVLFSGQLSRTKGPLGLLDAAPDILKEFPQSIFIFAGDGALQEELSKRVCECQLENHVLFSGHLSGQVLAAMYRIADCVVVPSVYEPFGVTALESMACKTPVVVSKVGGLCEIIEDEESGLVFTPGDPKQLAQQVIRLFSFSALRESLTEKAWEKCQKSFLWERIVNEVKEIYDQVLN